MIDPVHATGWLALGRLGLDLLRSVLAILPVGGPSPGDARKPDRAGLRADLANAKLARDLGYRLCRCHFPPKPMLWDKARRAFVCQDPTCGRMEDGAIG